MDKKLRDENKLTYQAMDGDEAGIRRLIELGVDTMARDGAGRTALMWAAWEEHPDCVRVLLPVSDARAVDSAGNTALMFAAAGGDGDCAELLWSASDVLAANESGQTASGVAAEAGHLELARALAERERVAMEHADISTQTAYVGVVAESRAHRL